MSQNHQFTRDALQPPNRSENQYPPPRNGRDGNWGMAANGSNVALCGWPRGPMPLSVSFYARLSRTLFDACLFLISCCFAVLGVFIFKIADHRESEPRNGVVRATQLAPTIWPIIFAAVVGSLMKASAHRKLENGAKLGMIEQLMGSQTVFGTIKTAWSLRRLSLATAMLLALWSLNPLGGQAALRSIWLENEIQTSTQQIAFANLDPWAILRADADALNGADHISWLQGQVYSVFGSALLAPEAGLQYMNGSTTNGEFEDVLTRLGGLRNAIKASSMDAWGNLRIPALHLLPGFEGSRGGDWVDVLENQIPPLSSLIGLPIRGVLPGGDFEMANTTFEIKTNYHKFECSSWVVMNDDEFKSWNQTESPQWKLGKATNSDWPFSHGAFGFLLQTKTPFTRDRMSLITANDSEQVMPVRDIIFGSRALGIGQNRLNDPILSSFATCLVTLEYVDARVLCSRTNTGSQTFCTTTAMRRSQTPHRSLNYTELEYNGNPMLTLLQTVFGPQHTLTSTPQERFLYNPSRAFTDKNLSMDTVALWTVAPSVFQNRLALLYNTWSRAAKEPAFTAGGPVMQSPSLDSFLLNATAQLSTRTQTRTYYVSIPWGAVFLASAAVLCLCAITSIAVRFGLRAPEILGWVSTVTREGTLVPVPSPAGALDGEQRARLLKDRWVRIQDVRPHDPVGRIAVDSDEQIQGCLRKGRLYE